MSVPDSSTVEVVEKSVERYDAQWLICAHMDAASVLHASGATWFRYEVEEELTVVETYNTILCLRSLLEQTVVTAIMNIKARYGVCHRELTHTTSHRRHIFISSQR